MSVVVLIYRDGLHMTVCDKPYHKIKENMPLGGSLKFAELSIKVLDQARGLLWDEKVKQVRGL